MREQEQIEVILCKLEERVPNMHSTRIVISILRRLLTLTPDSNLMVAWVYTTLIEQVAHQLADDPEKWTYQGHFSPARFDYFFPREERPQVTFLGIPADLREALMKLDEEYPGVFRTSMEAEHFARLIESEANLMGSRFKP
jgi:hypothetical protein